MFLNSATKVDLSTTGLIRKYISAAKFTVHISNFIRQKIIVVVLSNFFMATSSFLIVIA